MGARCSLRCTTAAKRGCCAPRRCLMKRAEITRNRASGLPPTCFESQRLSGTLQLTSHHLALVHQFGCENQMDAAGFERRGSFGERGDGGGGRVGGGNGGAGGALRGA